MQIPSIAASPSASSFSLCFNARAETKITLFHNQGRQEGGGQRGENAQGPGGLDGARADDEHA